MPRPWSERLSMLDYLFLAMEGPTTYMHIAATVVCEGGSFTTAAGGVDIQRLRAHVASRLPGIPRYRQRLAHVPIDNHPVWVDDDHFDLTYHVRHTSVPRPGTEAQLRDLAARLLERPLGRMRPLWEIWAVEGLEGGRFALVMKVHHCMVDGLAGAELLSAMMSPVPDAHIEEPVAWRPRPAPSGLELLRSEVWRRVSMSADLVRGLRRAVGAPADEGTSLAPRLAAVWQLVRDGVRRPVATPLNQRLGPHRRFHWTTHDLSEIKQIKNQFGGTVNDVVLSVVAGAVGEFFTHRGYAPGGVEFRAGVPVSVRPEAERHRGGNRVSAWLLALPIDERDPVRRLHAVRALSSRLKDAKQAMGAQVLTQAAEWTSANVLSFGALLANQTQPFHLIVTNVPGPQMPLYLLGAPIVAVYPLVPLFENQCLGIALFSYAGKLFWGFNADWEALPDVDRFVRAIDRSFRELHRLAVRDDAAASGASGHLPQAAGRRPGRASHEPAAPRAGRRAGLRPER